ncbi:S41 family peptidase [Deinococcus navajonensis]|uniref:S41 family peptidase n=1 Tax=Deinococcus navajonensis TaxID=309884 RepID=A0ABV8XJV0_9DEIO
MRLSLVGLVAASLSLSLSGASAGGTAGEGRVDGYAVFNEAARMLGAHYAGPDMLRVGPLLESERAALVLKCPVSQPSPQTSGRAAVEHVVTALHDGHTSVLWGVDADMVRSPSYVKRTGMWTSVAPSGDLRVYHVDDPSGAASAGVRPGDVVVAVEGQPEAGSPAALARQVRVAEEQGAPFVLRLKRGEQMQKVTLTGRLALGWPLPSLSWDGKVAVIALPSLTLGSGMRFANLVTEADRLGATGLIVDVRQNQGGKITDLLIAAQALNANTLDLCSVGRGGQRLEDWTNFSRQYDNPDKYVYTRWNKPLVVLTSGRTASSGEVLAYLARRAGARIVGKRPTAS